MLLLSSSDVAIATALKSGTLKVSECFCKPLADLGYEGKYWAISDEHGLIGVAKTPDEAQARIALIQIQGGL